MAERPFMQFYGSDFVGDTLHLSAEQIGAYMLLLIAMWNAKGRLPNDPKKLARVARVTPPRWEKMAPDLMTFFEFDELDIWHKRMRKNLKKLEEKASINRVNGSKGGAANALKFKEPPLAKATIPDKRNSSIVRATPEPEPERKEKDASHPKSARGSRLPAIWSIPNDWGKWAVDEFGLGANVVRAEADRFRDYWIAQPGQKGVKLDWLATWRNWCRTAFAPKAMGRAGGVPRKQSAAELASELLAEMEQADERDAEAERNYPPAAQHALPGPR